MLVLIKVYRISLNKNNINTFVGSKNTGNNIFNANITEKVENKFPKLPMAFHIFSFSHQFYGCGYYYSVNAY